MKSRKLLSVLSVVMVTFACGTNASGQLMPPGNAPVGATGEASDDGVHFFAGVRVWANRWEVPYFETTPVLVGGAPALRTENKTRTSGTEIVPMPTIGLTAGKWFGAATMFPRTGYDTKGALTGDVKRKEFDVNVGYAVLPRLSISLGYKEGSQDRLSSQITPSGIKVRGVLLGVSGSAPLNDRLSLYGNFAYGVTRNKTDVPDAAGKTRYNGDYQIAELGLSYSFGSFGQRMLQNISISAGYRFQLLTTKGITGGTTTAVAPFTLISTQNVDARTYTAGPIVALIASF
jgi:outer membrane protein with beta-barrel domain